MNAPRRSGPGQEQRRNGPGQEQGKINNL